MEPGYMVLSIYCVHMSSKWSRILDSRPIQGKDMSVEVYYDQFCIWKKKLEEVNYIGEEESFIDDFLYGLKMDLSVRVWVYKWKPRTLYGAFRRAEMEETMLSWKELSRKNDVDKVFEEMSQPNSTNIADTIEAEDVSEEKSNDVLDAPSLIAIDKDFNSMLAATTIHSAKEDVGGLGDSENKALKMFDKSTEPNQTVISSSLKAGIHLMGNVEQSFPSQNGDVEVVHHVFDEFTDPVPRVRQSFSLVSLLRNERNDDSLLNKVANHLLDEVEQLFWVKMHSIKVGCHTFDRMLELTSGENSAVCLSKDLRYEDGVIRVSSTKFSSKSKFELVVNFWVDEISIFMFDPGGSSWNHKGYGSMKSNGVKQNFDKMRSNLNVELWVGYRSGLQFSREYGKVSSGRHPIFTLIIDNIAHGDDFIEMDLKALFEEANSGLLMMMLSFDPGGCSLSQMRGDPFELYDWVKFAQLPSWSPESSTLTAGSGVLNWVKIRMEQIGYYVNGCLMSNSFSNKALMEHFENICNKGVTGWSSVVPYAAFCSNILRNGGSEELCNEAIDGTIENSVKLFFYIYDKQGNDRSMSTMKRMAKQLAMVCCVTYSSSICSCVDKLVNLLHTLKLLIGSFGCDSTTIQVCRNKSTFICLRPILQMVVWCVHFTINQSILEALLGNVFVCVINFCKAHSVQWPTLLQAFVSRYVIPFSIQLSGIESLYHDSLVHLQELGWKLDKNVNTKVMFIKFVAISLRDLGIFMSDICEDEAVVINSALELHHLPAWSGAIENVLSFVEGYNMRKLKVHDVVDEIAGDAMRILKYFGEYKHDWYSIRRKLGWVLFSAVWLDWYTQIVEYIALHYTKAIMDEGILLKQLVNGEQDWICEVKLLDHLKHKDILLIFMTDPSKVPMKSGVCMLLLYFAVAMMIFVLAILTDFVWDPGLVWVSHFTTLRTRRLLRGRICHVPRLKIRKITEESVGDVGYELLAVNDVIVISSLYLCRISVI